MVYEPRTRRHHQNVDGPFYVTNGECMSCGAPEMHAPTLMSHDSRGHCFFSRQPASPEETNEAIESTWASCCGALRYGGTDDGILIRLAQLGLADQCDFRLRDEPTPRARTCVSFEFAGQAETAVLSAKEITTYLADFVEKSGDSDGNVRSRSFTEAGASFVYEWGHILAEPCRATFAIEPQAGRHRWWVLISREDGHGTTAFAISIHKALIEDTRFLSIQWFTDDERKSGTNVGHSLPY
jgi:hypothetical protein